MARKEGVKEKILDEIAPILPKFKLADLLQIIMGAAILAVPIGFTEETWRLGENLPVFKVIGLMALSLFFISMFTYYHYHRQSSGSQQEHTTEFVKRVLSTYILSFLVVGIIMTLIEKAPWGAAALIAFKRVAIVTFPSSLSAAIADTLR